MSDATVSFCLGRQRPGALDTKLWSGSSLPSPGIVRYDCVVASNVLVTTSSGANARRFLHSSIGMSSGSVLFLDCHGFSCSG